MFRPFCTLERAVSLQGIALHCGQTIEIRLLPSTQLGIFFVRLDLPGSPSVGAAIENVTTTTHATTIARGEARVSTLEHLLAALWTSGLTHVRVELNGPEVPILDGSARGWMELLASAGRRELSGTRPIVRLEAPVWLESKGAQMLGLPLPFDGKNATFRVSAGVDFDVPGARAQTFDSLVDATSFERELAPARTFTLEKWIEPLRQTGLIRGGSTDNAVVVGPDAALSAPLRFSNEFARHKALDCVGDLALAWCATGALFHGHIIALRAGHGAHRDWMRRALESGSLLINDALL